MKQLALVLIATYLNLFGSMARTGLMLLVSGVLILAAGVFLEKKRRGLMQQLKAAKLNPENEIPTEA